MKNSSIIRGGASKGFAPLLIIILLAAGMFVLLKGLPSASLTGFTGLSLSDADFVSSSEFFSGKTYILTVAQGGMAQSAIGTITKEKIGSETGQAPNNDMKIDITYSKQQCEYPIRTTSAVPIYKLNVENHWFCLLPPSESEARSKCQRTFAGNSQDDGWYGKWTETECFCIEKVKQTGALAYNSIGNPYVHTISTIKVNSKGEEYSKDIDTKQNIADYIGSNVYARWNGYLSTGGQCASQAPYYGFNDAATGQWKLGYANNYNNYNAIASSIKTDLDKGRYDKAVIESKITNWNSYAASGMNQAFFGNIKDSFSLENALIEKELNAFVAVPTYTFYVKADWLGILQPVTTVDLQSTSCPKFRSGSNGQITATYKNTGNQRGTVTLWAECNPPFRQVGGSKDFTLESGETRTDYIEVSADVKYPTAANCVVKAKTLGNEDSQTVSCAVDPNIVCNPNEYRCQQNSVYQCNSAGSALEFRQSCSLSQECTYSSNGAAYCKDVEKEGGNALDAIMRLIGSLFNGILISGFILTVLAALAFFVPGMMIIKKILFNAKNLIIATLVLALVIMILTGGFNV